MSKFHINKHGVPAPCKAKIGNCPLGGAESHFDSAEEAQQYADQKNAKEHGLLPGMSDNKKRSEVYNDLVDKMGDVRTAINGGYIGIGQVESQMIYHKAEDVEGAYNMINDMRDENGSIKGTYEAISNEKKAISNELLQIRKVIEKDLYENGEIGKEIKKYEKEIETLENKIKETEKKVEENNSGDCPKCGEGKMVKRSGAYGTFIGCSNFPKCKHTQKEVRMSKVLPNKLSAAKYNRQIKTQELQAEAKKIQENDPKSKELNAKLEEVNKRFAIADYANKYESGDPRYPNRKGTKTPIEQYYEERKAADEKIEKQIGKNEIVFNSGQMQFGSNTLDADLRVDKDGNINNLYIEDEVNRGNIQKVVKIHESGEGNLELENGKRITMQHITNWNMDRSVSRPPQAWKLYTSEPKGEKYKGNKNVLIFNRDSSD